NWQNGILPGATDRAVFSNILPADATVHMDSDTPLVDKIRVANADDTYVRVFTGTQAVNNLEIDTGRAELRGTWSSTANAISSVGMTANRTAYLTLDGDAVFERPITGTGSMSAMPPTPADV
ncbi:MAG TPA: hypothetical protein P5111_06425, partial [Kiritimatiellia bacterium]|nr:hypothetical protein [Kiritimatiellia bacterium]